MGRPKSFISSFITRFYLFLIRERFEIHLMIKINGKKLRRFEVSMTSLSSRMLKMM